MIDSASVLRSIPVALDRRTGMFIEGIRVCIEMIDLAHRRLIAVIVFVDDQMLAGREASEIPQPAYTSLVLEAWSIIDSINRLSELAEHLPGVKKRQRRPGFRRISNAGKLAKDFRNTFQHIATEIPAGEHIDKWSVWGTVSWCRVVDANNIRSGSYLCGRVAPGGGGPIVNPAGKTFRDNIGLLTVSQGPASVSLSELIEDVEGFARELESMYQEQFSANPDFSERYGSDVLVIAHLEME